MKKIEICRFALILSLIVYAATSSAIAQDNTNPPTIPLSFFGNASVGGVPAPAGSELLALIAGEERGSTILAFTGKYGSPDFLNSSTFLVSGGVNEQNFEIVFRIKTPSGREFITSNERGRFYSPNASQSAHVRLNLTFPGTCSDGVKNLGEEGIDCGGPCPSCQSPPPSGGPSPGGGGFLTAPSCTENWTCGEWSVCLNGTQGRVCTDSGRCGTNLTRPSETGTCDIVKLEEKPKEICTPGQKVCAGDDLMQCSNGTRWEKLETCRFGCQDGACKPEPKPVEVEPREEEGTISFADRITGFITGRPITSLFGFMVLLMLILFIAIIVKYRGKNSKEIPSG